MHERLVIIGARGQGKVAADIALRTGRYSSVFFLDDDKSLKESLGLRVAGGSGDIGRYLDSAAFFVAVGNPLVRRKLLEELFSIQAEIASLIHPAAVIGTNVKIGKGSAVMAGAVINPDTIVGNGCIINTGASVDHDCRIGDYVHVSVGAHVSGTVQVGETVWIGAGATVSNNVNICGNCMIGAGAAVIKNIEESGTYVGVPARRKTMNRDWLNSGG